MAETESVCLKIDQSLLMNNGLISAILDSAGSYKRKTGCLVFPRYFDEVTLRSDFVEIMEKQFGLGLIFDNFWFPTDGRGLAHLSDEKWKKLASTGFSWIRLAIHGTEEEHDRFMGRAGAWNDLLRTAENAEKFGVEWFGVVYLNRHNAASYEKIREQVETMGRPATETGWMVPNWQRNPEFEMRRVSMAQISHLAEERSIWKSEKDIIGMIMSDGILGSNVAFDRFLGTVFLCLGANGEVFFSGGCHGDPFTGHRREMVLGSFPEQQSMDFFVEQYLENPPEPAKLLSDITWGELAEMYGDPQSDLVYRAQDLVVNRWGSMHLEKFHPAGT